MAEHWIDAQKARELTNNTYSLCERLHAGLIEARANLFMRDSDRAECARIPKEFWWAEGHEALEQDWRAGDFSTWIDHKIHLRAFGVQFALSGVLELLPFEKRALAARRFSVAGDPNWVTAKEARKFAYGEAGVSPTLAGRAIIEQARLGFISGRAVVAYSSIGDRHETDWEWEEREWDIPVWFWENFTLQESSHQDWELGKFSGRGLGPNGVRAMTLIDVRFLRESLNALLPARSASQPEIGRLDEAKPNLPDAALQRWWEKLAGARDALSQEQLWALARSDHPQNAVSRERIRSLADGRKPGPKRIRR